MLTERCVACGVDVPMGDAVHMLVNPKGGEDVVDGYLCRGCYEDHLAPLVAEGDDEQASAAEGDDEQASAAADDDEDQGEVDDPGTDAHDGGDAVDGGEDRTAEGA